MTPKEMAQLVMSESYLPHHKDSERYQLAITYLNLVEEHEAVLKQLQYLKDANALYGAQADENDRMGKRLVGKIEELDSANYAVNQALAERDLARQQVEKLREALDRIKVFCEGAGGREHPTPEAAIALEALASVEGK